MGDTRRIPKIRTQISEWEQGDYQKDMEARASGYGPAEKAKKLRRGVERFVSGPSHLGSYAKVNSVTRRLHARVIQPASQVVGRGKLDVNYSE